MKIQHRKIKFQGYFNVFSRRNLDEENCCINQCIKIKVNLIFIIGIHKQTLARQSKISSSNIHSKNYCKQTTKILIITTFDTLQWILSFIFIFIFFFVAVQCWCGSDRYLHCPGQHAEADEQRRHSQHHRLPQTHPYTEELPGADRGQRLLSFHTHFYNHSVIICHA